MSEIFDFVMSKTILKNDIVTELLSSCIPYMESSGREYVQEMTGCSDEECSVIIAEAKKRLMAAMR